jgi:hypothetical protein
LKLTTDQLPTVHVLKSIDQQLSRCLRASSSWLLVQSDKKEKEKNRDARTGMWHIKQAK